MENTTEEWKPIPFRPMYEASTLGKIRSLRFNKIKILKLRLGAMGYYMVGLADDSKYMVHRLIAQTFLPNPENKRTVNHKNGIKTDNRLINIEWMTDSENQRHARDTGLFDNKLHLQNTPRKLTAAQVLEIRKIYSLNRKTQRQIAQMFGVSAPSIRAIVYRHTWKHI